jgi:hypothetical protein
MDGLILREILRLRSLALTSLRMTEKKVAAR